MTPDLILRGSMRALRGGGGTLAELCHAVLDLLPNDPCILAVTDPGSALDRWLTGAISADRLLRHTAGSAEILAAQDRDRAAAPLRPWPGAPPAPAARLRRADTLYADSHPIGLIVIEDAADAPAILAGAPRLLSGQSPAIILGFATVPPAARAPLWEDLAALLAPFGHAWHDAMLLPASDPGLRRQSLVLLADQAVCALPPGLPPAAIPRALQGTVARDDVDLAELAWSGWHGGVPRIDPGAPAVAFDRDLHCRGFHPAETDGPTSWRWSGPAARASFALPQPGAGRWRLRLQVLDWGVAGADGALQAFAQGQKLRQVARDGGGIAFEAITVPAIPAPGPVMIDLITPKPRRASPDDPRRIGINCLSASLTRIA